MKGLIRVTHHFSLPASFRMLSPEQPDWPNIGLLTDPEYEKLIEDTKFENYHSVISEWTFRSENLPLDAQEAAFLVRVYEFLISSPGTNCPKDEIIRNLIAKIDAAKTRLGSARIFVRLSTRSPKDAVVDGPEFEALQENVKIELAARPSTIPLTNFNLRMHAFYEAARRAMASPSGILPFPSRTVTAL